MFSTSNLFMFGLSLLNVRSRNNINVNFLLYPCVTFCVVQQLSACFGKQREKKYDRESVAIENERKRQWNHVVLYIHTHKIITWKIENPFILVLSFNAPLVNTSALPLYSLPICIYTRIYRAFFTICIKIKYKNP